MQGKIAMKEIDMRQQPVSGHSLENTSCDWDAIVQQHVQALFDRTHAEAWALSVGFLPERELKAVAQNRDKFR